MKRATTALALCLLAACAGPGRPSAPEGRTRGPAQGQATAAPTHEPRPSAPAIARFDQRSVLEALQAEAQQQGEVRIILEFRSGSQVPSAANLWSDQLDPALSGQQDSVLLAMSIEPDSARVLRYRTIPNLAVTVSPNELGLLLQAMNGPGFDFPLRVGPDDRLVRHDTAAWGRRPLRESVVTTSAVDAFHKGLFGTGQHVAIIDDGVDYHEFTGEKIVKGGRFTWKDGTAKYGDPALGAAGLSDKLSHGTKAAAIICGNDSGTLPPTDVSGMAPGAQVVAIRIFGPGDVAYVSDLMLAWEELFLDYLPRHLAGNSELAAVNVSLGFDTFASPEACFEATTYGKSAQYLCALLLLIDAPVVCSAGNNYSVDSLAFPAVLATTLAVGAVDDGLNPLGPSNWSPQLTTAAPGYQIYGHLDESTGEMEFLGSGTSAAAPHVAGGLALLRQAYPKARGLDLLTAVKKTDTMTVPLGSKPSVPMLNIRKAMNLLGVHTAPTEPD